MSLSDIFGPAGPKFSVFALGSYYSNVAVAKAAEATPGNFDGNQFRRVVYAVKDPSTVKGYTQKNVLSEQFTVGDKQTREERRRQAIALCKKLLTKAGGLPLDELGLSEEPIFVPVPSTEAVLGRDEPTRWGPRDLARGLFHPRCIELVKFTDPPPKKATAEKGPRDWASIRRHLVQAAPLPPEHHSAVIVDDVLTSGGHLQAVAALLLDLGVSEVAGFCIGATVSEPVADPWLPRVDEVGGYGRE